MPINTSYYLLCEPHWCTKQELIFDGGSRVIHPNGDRWEKMSYFKRETKLFNTKKAIRLRISFKKPETPKIGTHTPGIGFGCVKRTTFQKIKFYLSAYWIKWWN